MANSTDETTSVVITREDIEAAETLIKLSQDTRYQPIEEDYAAPWSTQLLHQVSNAPQKPSSSKKSQADQEKQHTNNITINSTNSTKGKRIKLVADDTDETLMILQEWNLTKSNLVKKIFKDDADVGKILMSEPIKKQLTMSDVENGQGRLMLGKEQVKTKMRPLLKESEIPKGIEGLDVSVYGPDEKVHNMKFKMWSEDTPVLTTGWKDFAIKYKLKKYCDFLTIWMFRHRATGKICFAIDRTKFDTITGPLSSRISNSVFENLN